MVVETASSLEILLNLTQKCVWKNLIVESKANHSEQSKMRL